MKDNAIIVFVRKPELGKVKTRLAATVGNDKALEIYTRLLQHTKEVLNDVDADKFIFATEELTDDFWINFNIETQHSGGLGEKMSSAFEKLFNKKYSRILIIGSDCPGLSSAIISDAFKLLKSANVVIGPATDGGYYLLGMDAYYPDLFINKKWSTEIVLEQTIQDLEKLNLRSKLLAELTDVDEEHDVPEGWL